MDKADLNESILYELLAGLEMSPAPCKTERYGQWCEWVVAIGDNHVAYITMDDDAARELVSRYENRGMEFPAGGRYDKETAH